MTSTMAVSTGTGRIARVTENETRDAWARYLADTQTLDGDRYAELEPWAWTRLTTELLAINARRAAAR